MTAVGGGNNVAVERVVISWAVANARAQKRTRALEKAILKKKNFLTVIRDMWREL
jgi:hypothetical protein